MPPDFQSSESQRRFAGAWLLVSAVVLVLMLLHRSDSIAFFGRYSTRYMFTLAVMVGFTGIAAVTWLIMRNEHTLLQRLALPHSVWFARGVSIGGIALMALWWYFRPGTRQPVTMLFHFYVLALLFAGMVWLLIASGQANRVFEVRWLLSLLSVGVPALLLLIYLGKLPPLAPFDESLQVNGSWSIVDTGDFFPRIHPYSVRDYTLGSILRQAAGRWMALTGVGLNQLRLFYVLVGAVSLVFIERTANMLYGQAARFAAVAVGAFMLLHHNFARPDVFVALTLAAGLYVFFIAQRASSPRKHFLVGLLLAMAAEGHPAYGPRFAIGVGIIYLWDYMQHIRRTREWFRRLRVVYFVMGGATYLIFYLISRTLFVNDGAIDVGNTLETLRLHYLAQSRGSVGPLSAAKWMLNVTMYRQYVMLYPFEALLTIAVIVLAIWRRRREDLILVIVFVVGSIYLYGTLAHLNNFIGSYSYYAIHTMPIIALLTGSLVAQINEALPQPSAIHQTRLTWASGMTIVAIVAVFTADTLDLAQHRSSDNMAQLIAVGEQIDRLIPEDLMISGTQVYWLGMTHRRRYVSTAALAVEPLADWSNGSVVLNEWAQYGITAPEAVIVTRGLDTDEDIFAYIDAYDLVATYCFPINRFAGETVVYLPATQERDSAAPGCDG